MKLSITLPSIHPEVLPAVIDNINATTRNDHEIIVVSPFRAEGPNVVWIEEPTQRGCNFAHHTAACVAGGEFITAMVDDWHYADGWDEIILADYLHREQQLAFHRLLMGVRYVTDNLIGTNFGIYYATFPFMRRVTMGKFGWLGPQYRVGFGDSDLSMRVWWGGGRVEFSERAVLYPVPGPEGRTLDNYRKKDMLFTDEDMKLFLLDWAPKYGKDWDTSHLRGFNHDFSITKFPKLLWQRTVFCNNPSFRKLIGAV